MDYQKLLSDRAKKIKPSGIRKFFDLAATMKDCISLGVGEPDFKTPWSVREAGILSLEKGKTWYSSNQGMAQLRYAISEYLARRFSLNYDPEKELVVTVGGSEAIDIAIRALISEGDEVLICEPCFVSYTPIVQLAGGTPVPIVTKVEDEFKLTACALKKAITTKTKLLILPFPSNPTGAIMERDDLLEVANIIRDTDIIVLADEIYAELTYTGQTHVSFATIAGMRERTIVINGFSKAFAMTGWRLGFVAAVPEITEVMNKIHQFAIMCAPTTSQYAGIVAMRECDNEVELMRREYNERRRFMVSRFNEIGLDCYEPKGAFYVFPCIKSTGLTSEDFCNRLLLEQKVAVVPGNAFGDCGEGFIRVSYSYSIGHLIEALSRIEKFLKTS